MTGNDFVLELKARGFTGFTSVQLLQYVNWGYREVARRSRWKWRETDEPISLVAGDYDYPLSSITGFKSAKALFIDTPTTNLRKLKSIDEKVFLEHWLTQDLTTVSRSAPEGYCIWNRTLYVLPPTDVDTTLTLYYVRDIVDLTTATSPFTPTDYDEAILTAARWRCHIRAQEFDLASVAKQELEDTLFHFLDEETYEQEEQLDRVQPDDTWL